MEALLSSLLLVFLSLSPFASLSPQFFLLYSFFLSPAFPFPISLLYLSFSLPFPKLNIWKSSCSQSLIETELVTSKQLEGLTEHLYVINLQLAFVMGDGLLECNIIKSLKRYPYLHSDQIRSVAQSCLTLCDLMNRSTPGLPVHHQLPEFTQTHIHRVSDAIQPSHPLSSPSPPAPNPSQHQSLFQ